MESEGHSPNDRVVGHISATVRCTTGAGRTRSIQPAARARATLPNGSGNGPRQCSRGERPVESKGRRTQRVSTAAGWNLGYSLQQREMDAQRRGGSVSTRALRVYSPLGDVSKFHDI